MENIRYFNAPDLKTAFKVNLGCCFERVVYQGPEIGVNAKNDQEGDLLNSEILWCEICDPELKLVPISKHEYYQFKEYVNKLRS
jgi:hypothetical protein